MGLDLLRLDFLGLLLLHNCIGNLSLSLDNVLRVLRPHVIPPDALNRLLGTYDFSTIMKEGFTAHGVLEFDELLKDLVILKVSQRLVFDVAIDIGGRHVWVMATLQIDLELHILVLVNEFDKIPRFQEVTDACRRASEITEVKSDVFKLVNSSANHYFILL